MRPATLLGALIFTATAFVQSSVGAQTLTAHQQLARDIHKELVEINTVTATGDTLKAAQAMADRLKAAGFADDRRAASSSPAPRKGNLVARLRGTGARKPILLLAHIDVVAARPRDWSAEPFKLLEKDGYLYGRGVVGQQVHGRDVRREPDPLQAGRLSARARPHRRAGCRRRDSRCQSDAACSGC